MPLSTKIYSQEIRVGKAMAWAAYDADGRLLLNKGTIIKSQNQLDVLIQRGLYRQAETEKQLKRGPKAKDAPICPFISLNFLSKRLKNILSGFIGKKGDMATRIHKLARDIHAMCQQDFDAALGAVQLTHDIEYVLAHPLHVAILCELIAEFLEYDKARRERLVVSALTVNLGMLNLQAQLHQQKTPLTAKQRQEIQRHPMKSADILKAAGVEDEDWLNIVLQHHERNDGTGYIGLKDEDIMEEAKIIALADRYSAMISPREHRESLSANDSLKSLFLNKGKWHDETLSLIFIKLLGIFPPGSFVRLENGETAVVIKRPVTGMWPIVKSIITPRGGPFVEPLTRDCNDAGNRITELFMPDDLPILNLSALWGYTQ